jgi:hypothetical protein
MGGAGGDACPANVAYCMTHRTDRIGRSRRGRTYFAGVPESVTTGNYVTSTWSLAMTSAFNSVVADLTVSGWFFVIVSRFANKEPRGIGLSTIVTSSSFRDLRVDSQRGRLPK